MHIHLRYSIVAVGAVLLLNCSASADDFLLSLLPIIGRIDAAIATARTEAKQHAELDKSAREGEMAAVKEYRAGISNACHSLTVAINHIDEDGYSKDPGGYEKVLEAVESVRKGVRCVESNPPQTTSRAHSLINDIEKWANFVALAHVWLKENKPRRDAARRLIGETNEIIGKIERYGGAKNKSSVASLIREGMFHYAAATNAYVNMNFALSIGYLESAKPLLSGAVTKLAILNSDIELEQ